MMEAILEIQNLQLSFPFSHKRLEDERRLLRGIGMRVQRNRISALIGGNGVGKTTLFNLVNGYLVPDEGRILYHTAGGAMILNGLSPFRVARLGIGRLFQGSRTFGGLTIRENLSIAANDRSMEKPFYPLFSPRGYKKKQDRLHGRIDELFKATGFQGMFGSLDQPVRNLSYAQQRILNLLSLLMGEYDLVLLDEPCSGVSPEDWDQVGKILQEMQSRGITLLVIEHNLDFIRKYIQDCFYMSSGKIICSGPILEVLNMPVVRNEYLALC